MSDTGAGPETGAGRTAMAGQPPVAELPAPGMIAIRCDLAAVGDVLSRTLGMAVPPVRGVVAEGDWRLAWMSPDEMLLLVPRDRLEVAETLRAALSGQHHLVEDVSDMRALFAIRGDAPREVLAKLAPVDMHPDSFAPGEMRRTRIGQIPCAFWLEEDGARLICFRSVAQYALDILSGVAAETAHVGYFPQG